MQIKIFNIPIGANEGQEEEMNHFLRANKIIDIKKELALLDKNSCWTFCITYMLTGRPTDMDGFKPSGSGKVDYKDVLEPAVFERFSQLRKIRKQIAENDAVPAFAVFTDAELAEMAKEEQLTLAAMGKISGIGKKKIEKYGKFFVADESILNDETSGIFDGTDSQSGQPV